MTGEKVYSVRKIKVGELSLRDLIAIVAMAVELHNERGKGLPDIAEGAYLMADSMMEAREVVG